MVTSRKESKNELLGVSDVPFGDLAPKARGGGKITNGKALLLFVLGMSTKF